jgi:hypothetical protein
LPRDYAVDPSVNTETYPLTEIDRGFGGFLLLLADANYYYEAYSIHGKGAISNSVVDWNVAAIGLNDGAEPYGMVNSLNKSAVARIALLPQGTNGAISAHVSTLLLVGTIVVCGGASSTPITAADLKWVATHSIGVNLLFQGIGTYSRVYAPMQIGGDHQTVISIDGETFAMPTTYDGKNYFDWNADDNVAGWEFYGLGSGDSFTFTNCIWVGAQQYRWRFNSSHSGSTTLDFAGSKVQGASVILYSTVTLAGMTFRDCAFTNNGATLTDCAFINTTVGDTSPGNADNISTSTFTSGGTGYGLEVSGSAADMTLNGLTFSGYATSNGTTGNEAIHIKATSGSMTIYITGGGSLPSIHTEGATVAVVNARTVKVTAKDANTGGNIESARVGLWATTGDDVTITRSGSTATVDHGEEAHGYQTGQKVAIFGADQGEYNGIKTITYIDPNSYSYAVSGTPTTPATGTIKSHRVILDGLTSALGVIQDTAFPYTADLAVVGRARLGNSYRTSPISGTITSAAGFDAIAYMVSD